MKSFETNKDRNLPKTEVSHEHIYTEDMLADIESAHQTCVADPISPGCNLDLLHSKIHQSDLSEIFTHFESQEIVTLSQITDNIKKIVAKVEAEVPLLTTEEGSGDEELDRIYKLLKNRDVEIRTSVRRYTNSVAQFSHIKKRRAQLGDDFPAKFVDIDKRRRAAHDGLIDTLALYSRLVNELDQYDLLGDVKMVPWDFSVDVSKFADEDVVFVFSPQILANRDLVKDWAMSAHMYRRLSEIQELQNRHESNE